MKVKKLINRSMLLLAVSFIGFSCCQTRGGAQKELDEELMHTVLIWADNEADLGVLIAESTEFLEEIDEVKTYFVGTPAMTPRDVVDNSYSVFLTMTFENQEDLKTYLDHPAHVAFLNKHKTNWDRILIYDSKRD
ncbi:MAG: Dabb family protein [Cyclobacteriaceae bacterium]